MKSSARPIIEEMKRRIVGAFHPDKIILFGSYARGHQNSDSDVDLLVILPIDKKEGAKRKKTVEIYRLLAGIGLSKDVVVASPQEVEKYRDIPGTLFYPALREGRVLYERPS